MQETARFIREFEVLLGPSREFESATDKTLIHWVQETLNTLQQTGLAVSGRLDQPTQAALGAFQRQQGLSVTEKADAPTERKLAEMLAVKKAGVHGAITLPGILASAHNKIEDWTHRALKPEADKEHLITNSYRHLDIVKSLVLHHMAFKRRDKQTGRYSMPENYLRTRAHFCIFFDGRIAQLHPVSRMIWHSNCTSPRSVGVEFEGNFPNTEGKWWYSRDENGNIKTRNEDRPTKTQVEAGRFLMKYLQAVYGFDKILAHRQSSSSRTNDPGPDIWFNVGEWALKNLGVGDGGENGKEFSCKTGKPIPPEWRNWTSQYLVDSVGPSATQPRPAAGSASEPARPSTSVATTSPASVPKAHQANRYYAENLGWDAYRMQVYTLLGFDNMSPTENMLVEAVANWQRQNGFSSKNADGIIGPKTWEKMKQAIGKGNSSTPKGPVNTGGSSSGQNSGWLTDLFGSSSFSRTWGDKAAAGKHLDAVTHARLSNLNGKTWEQMTPTEKSAFNQAWVEERRKLLAERKQLVLNGLVPQIGGAKIPFGFKMAAGEKYGGKGLENDSSLMPRQRLDEVLVMLHRRGKIRITQDQLDVFQRIANVETSGMIQTLNTYDRGIVSSGFMQFTMHVGKIQEWILLNETAFRRFGIELDKSQKHDFGGNERHYMIKGVSFSDRNALRWNGWAERFYYSGFDEAVIAAEVQLALKYLDFHLNGLRKRLQNDSIFETFLKYYATDPYVRGLFQASYNNNPAKSTSAVGNTIREIGITNTSTVAFLDTYKKMLVAQGWARLVEKTASGTSQRLA